MSFSLIKSAVATKENEFELGFESVPKHYPTKRFSTAHAKNLKNTIKQANEYVLARDRLRAKLDAKKKKANPQG